MASYFSKINTSNYVIVLITCIIYVTNVMFSVLKSPESHNSYGDGKKFAGSASCATCHKEIYKSHVKTAHYLDSKPAAKEFIKGSFSEGKNRFVYNRWMEVVLVRKNNRYFQSAFINGTEIQSEPFDIVIGSGRKGQTYLYWDDNKLFQLPVSYYTPLDSWCNSPGYSTNFIKFDRIIPAECLECHGTYAKTGQDSDNHPIYDKEGIIYGIDCERCHGPGAEHVEFHDKHPGERTAKYIISTKLLTRQQRLDACALCHSGFRNPIQPPFSFMVGDNLDDFSHPSYNSDSTSSLDVHGNQYGLLTASKCFQMAQQLDCSSCHNVHVDEVNSPKTFSQRCTTCHADVKHNSFVLPASKKPLISANCIDCHMPLLPSQKIFLNVTGAEKAVPDLVRTHRVAIYPGKTKEFLDQLK